MKHFGIFLFILTLSFSCRSVKEGKTLVDCNYSFTSISDLTINGVNIDGKSSFRDIGMSETVKLSQALMAKKMPITLTANIAVQNPNSKVAALNTLDWILEIRGKDVAKGTTNERFEVDPNKTEELSILVNTDLGDVMKAFSLKEMKDILFNISNTKGLPVEAKLKIRPSFKVGKKEIKSPTYFTVDIPVN